MFDTMTLTKTVASLCGALLIFLLFGWGAEAIYHSGGHGKGEEQAYSIDTGEGEVTEVAAEEEVPFEELYASADAGAGERLWRQCSACHALDGRDGTGPHLNGIVGREKAAVEGYDYSDGMAAQAGDVWSPENLSAFLENPREYTPGTKMTYSGMRDAEDRANLIAYLDQTEE